VIYQLQSATVLRPEPQAALWFQRQTAEMLELDLEGLETLLLLLQGRSRFSWRAWRFRNHLLARGFIRRAHSVSAADLQAVQTCLQQARTTQAPLRSRLAPEVLHISLTDACQQRCGGCFFSNQDLKRPNRYLARSLFSQLCQRAAEVRVFQLALGGGEPLMHPELLEMVTEAAALGLLVNLTSNGGLLTLARAQALKRAGLGQFQLSLTGAEANSHERLRPGFEALWQAVAHCREVNLRWGMNVLVTRENLAELDAMLARLDQAGAASVNIIRPKPSELDPQWLETQQLTPAEYRQLQRSLQRWQARGRFLLVTDTSLSFLRSASADRLYAAGVAGCSAGRRMLSVQVDGRVSPCSHVPMFDIIAAGDFMPAWQQSQHLERFRQLEETLQGACQSCELKSVCRGCRAVVWQQTGNFDGEDLQCPKRQFTSF